ncbi:MAG: hypothetical protein O3A20_10290 [Planctomycetota bacterium]|nr:hypothetical protein [Planctomycetota bacterium]
MADTLLPLIGYVGFFVLLHVLALARVEPVFPRAFKLSRAAAAVVLTALGIAALISAAPHWRTAFLYRHQDGDWMRQGLLVVYGHLLADFVWMYVGLRRFKIQPRKDLIIHHLLGVIAFGVALWLKVGYAVALITMITELLPVTTGLDAWSKRIAAPGLTAAASRARLHVLAWLRLPLWLLLFAMMIHVLLRGDPGDLAPVFGLAAGGLACLVALDAYWIRKCLQDVDFY